MKRFAGAVAMAVVAFLLGYELRGYVPEQRGETPTRQASADFDLEFASPVVDTLQSTVEMTARFDVVGSQVLAAASGVGIEFQGRYFLLTAHHTFRGVGVPSAAVASLGFDAPPRITCVRQQQREVCPTGALSLFALPDRDIAVIGPFESAPTQTVLSLDEPGLASGALEPGGLFFSWSYPYGYGPSFSRSRFAYVQNGPLLSGRVPLGSGMAVDTLFLFGWVSPGDSGSPLFSFEGEFAGIVNGGGSDDDSGVGYVTAIPAWEFVSPLRTLLAGHFAARGSPSRDNPGVLSQNRDSVGK